MDVEVKRYCFEHPLYSSGLSDVTAELLIQEWCVNYANRRRMLSDGFVKDLRELTGLSQELIAWASEVVDDHLRNMGFHERAYNPLEDFREALAEADGRYINLELQWG